MRRKLVPALILLTLTFISCGPEKAQAPQKAVETPAVPAPKKVEAPPQRVDQHLNDWTGFISGMSAASEPFAAWEAEPAWREFAKEIDERWASFDRQILAPMEKWAGEELREERKEARTIFYPFGGPDFVTALAFFPDATKMILMGLEPVGSLPDLERVTPEWRDAFFKDFDTILPDFLKRGYFVTEHMNEVYAAGRVDGSLPVIAFFLRRTGNEIVDIRRLAPGENGEWIDTPYRRLAGLPKRPYGVRIDYLERGSGPLRSVYYFSCDLEDKAFAVGSPLYRFFAGFGEFSTCIKSASYLMHYAEFANIRNLILQKSLFVIEDDTGIPYRYFRNQRWAIEFFGEYTKPVEDFSGVEQADLKQVYEDPATDVKKLPFHYGYRWQSHVDNLMIMRRTAKAASAPAGRQAILQGKRTGSPSRTGAPRSRR